MSRRLRFIPEGGAMVEVTYRTIHRRFLLRPGRRLNASIVGILGRAQARHRVAIYGAVVMSNHLHLLLGVDHAEQMAAFMSLVGSKLAKEIKHLTGWGEKIWGRRYQAIVVSEEEAAQVARLRYILAHGVKEGLVARPEDWPGVHCAEALVQGRAMIGVWLDRTKAFAARSRGERELIDAFAEPETLRFQPLPCWEHLTPQTYRARVAELIKDVRAEGEARRRDTGRGPVGAETILRQDPLGVPSAPNCSPAPAFHAITRTVRRQLNDAYRDFVAAYHKASRQLRESRWPVTFPPGSFPPALPFVTPACARSP